MGKLAVYIFGLFILFTMFILYISYINSGRDKCIKNGGSPVDNTMGIFEKCVYNGIEK